MLYTFLLHNFLQFPFELMVSESVFLIGRERREGFFWKLPLAVVMQSDVGALDESLRFCFAGAVI